MHDTCFKDKCPHDPHFKDKCSQLPPYMDKNQCNKILGPTRIMPKLSAQVTRRRQPTPKAKMG